MIDWLSSIPPSIVMMISGVAIAFISVYFNRAGMAHKITQASGFIVDEYEKRMDRMEADMVRMGADLDRSQRRENQLSARVSSLEHNDRENQAWIKSLETKHEALLKRMKEWNEGINILITQIEGHDSKPNWRPKE